MNTARMMLPELQREPQDDQHDHHRADAVDQHAFLDGREFLVGDRHRPGEAHARAVCGVELQIGTAWRIASVAFLPGSSAVKSSSGRTSMNLRRSLGEPCR